MSQAADRMWSVRDAVLLWLYEKAAEGDRSPRTIDIPSIESVAGWKAASITDPDLSAALGYLKSEGFIDGTGAWGGGVVRPRITSLGEKQVAAGLSVRPGPEQPANTTGVTNTYNITNHGPANVAVNSSDFTQTINVGSAEDKVNAVAEALERFASMAPPNVDEAQEIADELRTAATNPEANKGKLKALLASAIGSVTVAAGTEVGKQVADLAVAAIQSLG